MNTIEQARELSRMLKARLGQDWAELDKAVLTAELAETIVDRDDWKDEALSAQERFKRAEAELAALKAQEPVAWINYKVITDENGNFASIESGRVGFTRLSYGYDWGKSEPLYLAAGAQAVPEAELRAELIEIKSQFEMALEREVYWNHCFNLLSDQLASLKTKTPVAYVKFLNNEVDYDSDAVISNTAGDCMDEAIEWRPVYLAAGTQPVPPGYQLVPVEPTKAMVKASKPWLKHYGLMRASDKENASIEAYKAMLSAAKEQS